MTAVYDAFVSSDGKADYLLPSAAFLDGKSRVFVQPGEYLETKDIVIPAGGILIASDESTTIINFGNNVASVVCDASYGNIESKGTIEVKHNSTAVVGTDTTFTNIPVGTQYIYLDNRAFEISSVTDDNNLVLAKPYRGSNLTGAAYKAMVMKSGIKVSNVTIRNSAAKGIVMSGYRKSSITNVTIESCADNLMHIDNCTECVFSETSCNFGDMNGYHVIGSTSCEFGHINATSSNAYGFYCDSDCVNLMITSSNSSANGTNYFINGKDNSLTSTVSSYANVDGIVVDGVTNKIVACASNYSGNDNVHVLETAQSTLICAVNFNVAGSNEFNNESPTTAYAVTFP